MVLFVPTHIDLFETALALFDEVAPCANFPGMQQNILCREKTTQHIATGKYPINDKTSPKNNVPAVLNLQCCSWNVQVFLNLWLFLVYFVFTRLDKVMPTLSHVAIKYVFTFYVGPCFVQ